MLFEFETEDPIAASAALVVYATYRSRDVKRGPKGFEMWGQIERYARASSKRAVNIAGFLAKFKRKMACQTINPRFTNTNTVKSGRVLILENGEIIQKNHSEERDFMLSITEANDEVQKMVVEILYKETQRIILLVRDRLEREKTYEVFLEGEEK